MVYNGLSWWQSWLCVWIGYTIAGCFIVLTGRIGATYHIGFPVVARSSFGIWGNLWPVFNRAAMACIWYGVQSYIGGRCVYIMIRSMSLNWVRHDCFYIRITMSKNRTKMVNHCHRIAIESPTLLRRAPAPQLPTTPHSSYSGWYPYPPSGFPFTRFGICSRSRRTLFPSLPSPSSSGPSSGPAAWGRLCISPLRYRAANWPGSLSWVS